MIRNGNVAVSSFLGCHRHRLKRLRAVAPRSVHLEIALHVVYSYQVRELPLSRCFNLSSVLPQLGRNERES